MKKIIFLFIVCLIAFYSSLFSQKKSTYSDKFFLIGISGQVGLPLGKNAASYSYQMSGDGNIEIKVMAGLNLLANLNYSSFVKKSIKTNGALFYGGTIAFLQALTGVKYIFPNDLFLTGNIGWAHSQSGGGNSICYKSGLGYDFSRNIDIELLLSAISKAGDKGGALSTLNFKIGYFF